MEPKGDWPGVEAPAIEVGNEGDDAAELLSISDALIGGEEPSGDGFGGELLELRRAKLSREGSGLGFRDDDGVLTLPFLFAAADELFDFGVSRRCFFTGDFVTLGARDFLDFSRELSLSRSEVTEEAVDSAFVIAVVVCRRGGDTAFFSSTFGDGNLTSSMSMSSSESSTLSADFTLELIADSLMRLALLVFAVADFGGLPIGPLGFAIVAFAVVGFLPFLPIIRDIASFCAGFPVLAGVCEADRAIGSPPLAFLVTCRDGLEISALSAVTVMLGGAGFGGSLTGCGGAGFGSTLPLSPGARIICHSDASLDNRSRLKAARVFIMAWSRSIWDG